MKYCPECGKPVARESSKFCDNCGAPLYSPAPGYPTTLAAAPREEKSPFLASLFSSVIPGLGQVYNGMTARGAALFAGTLAGLFLLLIPGLIVWLYAIYDAHAMASKMNRGEIPFMPASAARMVLFAVVAVFVVVVIVILLVLAVMSAVGEMMQGIGTVPGTLPSGFGF
ncbi:MAG TPA: zinc ribbon domain-containing protein [Methanoregula sp.]|nr:zinc ribbon domain-containing protein [Methanoregula sp.]